jgi:hypothetical protein
MWAAVSRSPAAAQRGPKGTDQGRGAEDCIYTADVLWWILIVLSKIDYWPHRKKQMSHKNLGFTLKILSIVTGSATLPRAVCWY